MIVPGFSLVSDIELLRSEVLFYFQQFGIDKDVLQDLDNSGDLASVWTKPYKKTTKVVKNRTTFRLIVSVQSKNSKTFGSWGLYQKKISPVFSLKISIYITCL